MSTAPPPPGISPAPAPVNAAPGTWQTGISKPKPPRLIINGVEGIGKTSIGTHAPGAAIIMARGETGFETLLGSDRVPQIPHMLVDGWRELIATVKAVAAAPGDIKTLVLDAFGGFERLCHEFHCNDKYKGDWGPKGFTNYSRGYDTAVSEWLKLIAELDKCRDAGVATILLSHITVKPFDNPEGESYSRYETACHKKTWDVTHKWADAVLFMNFKQSLDESGQKTHALTHGGRERIIYTERSDAYDAKNRYGMPTFIKIPDNHTKSWSALAAHIPYYSTPATAPAAPQPKPNTPPPAQPVAANK